MEFLDPIRKFPKLWKTVKVTTIDVDGEELIVCVRQGHVEELRGHLLEVNGGP